MDEVLLCVCENEVLVAFHMFGELDLHIWLLLALISTPFVFEAPNLHSTLIFMLLMIF